jgi:TolA-binding protein
MTKYLLSFLVASSLAAAQEVSVYGSSDSSGSGSYGLTSSEKHILKNQESINNLTSKMGDVNSLLESIKTRLEGLESTYEGDSAKLNTTSRKVDDLMQKVGSSSDLGSNNTNSSSSGGDAQLADTVNGLKIALTKLSTLVNKINSEYVSSNELEKNMGQFITREEFEALKKAMGVKTSQVSPTTKLDSKSGVDVTTASVDVSSKKLATPEDKANLLKEAKSDFDSKKYDSSTPKYEKLLEANYKPAEVNYYLAQNWYMRKKYDVAISYYKKSAMLNDKAAYMPTLLLHSAISFEKSKDKENAKSFYSTLIDLYPSSSEAKEANQNLSKLK